MPRPYAISRPLDGVVLVGFDGGYTDAVIRRPSPLWAKLSDNPDHPGCTKWMCSLERTKEVSYHDSEQQAIDHAVEHG